jgi:glycosyltransferase involved in cell wall biosynthesis
MTDEINILTYIFSKFAKPGSRRKGGGGWLRFQKMLDLSKNYGLEYNLIEFKSINNPLVIGIPTTLLSLFKTLFRTKQIVKSKNIRLILCPIEDPWLIILSFFSSKITNRRFAVFLNSVPFYGLADTPAIKIEDISVSFSALLKNVRVANKSAITSLLSASLWYLTFRILKSSFTSIICLSSVLADEISKLGLKKNIVPIFPGNGIEYDKIASTQKSDLAKYDAFFAAGSLLPQKGLFDVIKIWRLVVDHNASAKLAIAGRLNPEHMFLVNEMADLISRLGLKQNVIVVCDPIVGMSQESLWREMKNAKILIYPSRKDAWPLVIGEALACGLPVVAYDLSGVNCAYSDCPAVYLEKIGATQSSSKTVLSLICNNSLQKCLSHEALQYAEKHSWNHVIALERQAFQFTLKTSAKGSLKTKLNGVIA